MHCIFALTLVLAGPVPATVVTYDPCAHVASSSWVTASQAHACELTSPFNQTRSQFVIDNLIKALQYYSLETWFIASPNPLIPHNVNVRQLLQNVSANVAANKYATDWDFNIAVMDAYNQEHDGHTIYTPRCANSFTWTLPFSIAALASNVNDHIAFPTLLVNYDFPNQARPGLEAWYNSAGFHARKYDGSRIKTINGEDADQYLYNLANQSSIYHGLIGGYESFNPRYIRLMSRYSADTVTGQYTQELGNFARRSYYPGANSVTLTLQLPNKSNTAITVPWSAQFIGTGYGTASYIANNCAASQWSDTVSQFLVSSRLYQQKAIQTADAQDVVRQIAVDTADMFNKVRPDLEFFGDKVVTIDIYQLKEHPKVGVVYMEQFDPSDGTEETAYFHGVSRALYTGLSALKAAGVKHILIDQSGNKGGYLYAGAIALWSLWPNDVHPGFPSVIRSSDLARRQSIAVNGNNDSESQYYWPGKLNLNHQPITSNAQYMDPPVPQTINGVADAFSHPVFDNYGTSSEVTGFTSPPFNGTDIVLVANSICASTCSMFSSYLYQKHGVRSAVFGGPPSAQRGEFDGGVKGSQVYSYADMLTELRHANLADDPAAPQPLPIHFAHTFNLRNALPYNGTEGGILEYVYEEATKQYQFTMANFNRPQVVWEFVAEEFFGSD